MKMTTRKVLLLPLLLSAQLCFAAPSPQFKLDLSKAFKTATDATKALKEFSEDDEIALGQEVTSNLLSLGPLVDNKEVQSYVNKVGRWVSSHSERPDLPWTFIVIDVEPANAFAAPGGYVVVTTGLLKRLNSEAELAGVLGHEVSHVVRKHHLSAIKKADTTAFLRSAGESYLDATGKATSKNKLVLEFLNVAIALYGTGLDKDSEIEADRMGVVLATRSGYDPFALAAALQAINGNKKSDVKFLFSTHPPINERLTQLDRAMGSKFDHYEGLPVVEDRFQQIKSLLNSSKK